MVTHPLNILLLVTAGLSAMLTGSWVPLAVGGAAELLWLVWGGRFTVKASRIGPTAPLRDTAQLRDQQVRLSRVSEALRRRFLALDLKKTEIRRLVGHREGLATELVAPELDKVDGLADRFLDLAVRATELGRIVEEQDVGQGEIRAEAEEPLEETAAVQREHRAAMAGLERIERGVASIRNRVATLGSPEELERDIDEVFRTLDVATRAVRETEAVGRRSVIESGGLKH